jgi:prevent-host-death family protein
MVVNIHEAKTQLSKLLARVAAGEEITIAKAGRPIARLCPIHRDEVRVPGRYAGQGFLAEDFDDPLQEIEGDFYGQ